jgi:integrase
MPRPRLEIGSHGIISVAGTPGAFTARARFRDGDGVTRAVERGGATKGIARAALNKALQERSAHIRGGELDGGSTVAQLLAIWWPAKLLESPDLSRGTRFSYEDIMGRIIVPGVGSLLLREATTGRMDRWLTAERAERAAQSDLARTILNQAFMFAARRDAVAANPIQSTSKSKPSKSKPQALSDEQLERLREALRAPRKRGNYYLEDWANVQLGLATRVGESLALTVDDLDLDNPDGPRVHIRATVSTVLPIMRQLHTKDGPDGQRIVTPPVWVADILRKRAAGVGPGGLLFTSSRGTMIDPHHIQQAIRRLRDDADLPSWVTPHTLRRTALTRIAKVMGIDAAAAYVDHSSTAITERHYVEALLQPGPDVRAALDSLAP